jgi:hypothetical protein
MSDSIKWPIKDFSAAWVPDSVEKDPDNIPDNGLEQADNCDINGRGGLSKRLGTAKLNTASFAANCKQVDEWIKSDSSVQLIGVVGTDFCKFAEDGAKTVVQALNASAGKVWWFPTITGGTDNIYFGDTYKYFVWDGVNPCVEVTPAAGANLANVKAARKVIWHEKSHRFFAITKGINGVSFSALDDPTYFRLIDILYPTQAEGVPVGIEEFGDCVLVRYTFGAYIWRGYDPNVNVIWQPVPLKFGGFNPWDSVKVEGSLLYPGQGGIYTPGMSLLGTNITEEASGDLVPNIAINRVVSVINSITNKDIVCTIDDGSKTYIAYSDVANATSNSKVLVWQRQNGGGFTRYIGMNVNHWCLRKNGDLLFATNNYIMKAKQTAYNDNGVAIRFLVKTKWFNFGMEVMNHLKKLFTTTITSQQNQTASSVDVTVEVDNKVSGITVSNISLNSGFIWGMVYGPPWGAMKIITKVLETVIKGIRFRVTFENNVLNEAIDLYGLSLRFKIGKPSGEKVN